MLGFHSITLFCFIPLHSTTNIKFTIALIHLFTFSECSYLIINAGCIVAQPAVMIMSSQFTCLVIDSLYGKVAITKHFNWRKREWNFYLCFFRSSICYLIVCLVLLIYFRYDRNSKCGTYYGKRNIMLEDEEERNFIRSENVVFFRDCFS